MPLGLLRDLSDLIMGGLTKEEAKVVRRAGFLLIYRVSFLIFVCFAMGWLSVIGVVGFARANEIDAKIQPLSAAVTQLAAAVKAQADAATQQTLQLLRVAITDGLVKKCHAPKEETKEIYRKQVSDAQARYYSLTGAYYPEHACSDL